MKYLAVLILKETGSRGGVEKHGLALVADFQRKHQQRITLAQSNRLYYLYVTFGALTDVQRLTITVQCTRYSSAGPWLRQRLKSCGT